MSNCIQLTSSVSSAPLYSHTVPQDIKLYNTIGMLMLPHVSVTTNPVSLLEYNGHNMYGITEANSTAIALEALRGKRAFGT